MRMSDLMERKVVTVAPNESVSRARELMRQHAIRHLPVVLAERELVGVVTDLDVHMPEVPGLEKDAEFFADTPIEQVMTTHPVTLGPDATTQDAENKMRSHKVACIPIVEGDRLVGIVTSTKLLEAVSKKGAPSHTKTVHHFPHGRH